MTVDGADAELSSQVEDIPRGLSQGAVLRFQPVQLPLLGGGRTFPPPAAQLLGVDIDERELLLMDAFHSIDGSVIEDVRAATRLGQGLQMIAGIAEGAVDHAANERQLADRLPLDLIETGHAFALDHAITRSGRTPETNLRRNGQDAP